MPTFAYSARDESGRLVKGVLEAESQVILADRLRKMGYLVTRVEETVGSLQGLKRLVIGLHRQFSADDVIIEDKSSGTSLIQQLKSEGSLYPIAFNPEGDKIMRMHAQSSKIQAGQVLLPREAPWLDTFLNEILAFPGSSHDDQVDSLSQFLKWANDQDRGIFQYEFLDLYEDAIPSPHLFL